MTICFQFDFVFHSFFFASDWSKSESSSSHFQRIKFGKKSFWTFSFDFFVHFGEFVKLDVACPMKPKQTAQTCALSSTASEVRSINLHRQDHRSGRSARPDGLSHREDRPRDLIKNHDRREPVFSSLFASQTTRAPTR